jgi:hypothetical protein
MVQFAYEAVKLHPVTLKYFECPEDMVNDGMIISSYAQTPQRIRYNTASSQQKKSMSHQHPHHWLIWVSCQGIANLTIKSSSK